MCRLDQTVQPGDDANRLHDSRRGELAKGGFLAPHRHPQAEIYYVLAGKGAVTVDGETHAVVVGSALFIPGGSEHAIRNDADELLRFFYVFAVDHMENVEYTFS